MAHRSTSTAKASTARKRETGSGASWSAPAIAGATLAAVVLAAAFAVDPRAEAAFDAPKRLLAMLGASVAAFAVFSASAAPLRSPFRGGLAGAAATSFAIAIGAGVVSALASSAPGRSLDAVRVVLVFALFVPLGASAALEGGRGRLVLAAFLLGCVGNAVISILQAGGLVQPVALGEISGRAATGALLGNEGQLALGLALGAVAALVVAVRETRSAPRLAAAAIVALLLATIGVNRSLTAIAASAAGATVVLFVAGDRRARAIGAGLAVAATLAAAATPALRHRAADSFADVRAGRWDALLTHRAAPWSAAIEMFRERPLLGHGPGAFARESLEHRFRAEARARRSLASPWMQSAYGEAHSEPLQLFAETGAIGGAALLAATAALLAGLVRARRRAPESAEPLLLLAVLVAAVVESLAWFPLQVPFTALPILLAAGRAWRLVAEEGL